MTSSQPAGWTAAELAQAAARGQLDLHYQPLVDLRDHRILPAELLEIELTESVAFGNPALFASFDALRAIGVRFAADDFGTGYSCLQHLKCCPITTLKIDQSFVARLPDDARDQTIVRAVMGSCRDKAKIRTFVL